MSRKRKAQIRNITPDRKYNSGLVAKFVNCIMWGGKKSTAENIVYGAIAKAAGKLGIDELECFEKSIENVRPILVVVSQRFGGATYQIPKEVEPRRAVRLAMTWIIDAARKRKVSKGVNTIADKLAAELIDSYNQSGVAFKKREDTHKMAESNRAFAHLAR
jgi:small subunit ribosomal protein S7